MFALDNNGANKSDILSGDRKFKTYPLNCYIFINTLWKGGKNVDNDTHLHSLDGATQNHTSDIADSPVLKQFRVAKGTSKPSWIKDFP